MSAEIVRLPVKALPRPIEMYEDDPRVVAINGLRLAIQACVKECGRNVTVTLLKEAIGIPDKFDWRAKARGLITGDKKS